MYLRSSQRNTESSRGNRHANQMIAPWPSKNQGDIMCQVMWGQVCPRERENGEGAQGGDAQ